MHPQLMVDPFLNHNTASNSKNKGRSKEGEKDFNNGLVYPQVFQDCLWHI